MKKGLINLFSIMVLFVSYAPYSFATNFGDVVDVIRDITDGSGDYYRRAPEHPGRGGDGRGGDNCQAYDRGYEEHYGGHDSCRSCLRHHGDCVVRCERSMVRCIARGSDFHHEYDARRPGVSDNEFEARQEALAMCQREGLHRCYVTRCERSRGEVSTRPCGRF